MIDSTSFEEDGFPECELVTSGQFCALASLGYLKGLTVTTTCLRPDGATATATATATAASMSQSLVDGTDSRVEIIPTHLLGLEGNSDDGGGGGQTVCAQIALQAMTASGSGQQHTSWCFAPPICPKCRQTSSDAMEASRRTFTDRAIHIELVHNTDTVSQSGAVTSSGRANFEIEIDENDDCAGNKAGADGTNLSQYDVELRAAQAASLADVEGDAKTPVLSRRRSKRSRSYTIIASSHETLNFIRYKIFEAVGKDNAAPDLQCLRLGTKLLPAGSQETLQSLGVQAGATLHLSLITVDDAVEGQWRGTFTGLVDSGAVDGNRGCDGGFQNTFLGGSAGSGDGPVTTSASTRGNKDGFDKQMEVVLDEQVRRVVARSKLDSLPQNEGEHNKTGSSTSPIHLD